MRGAVCQIVINGSVLCHLGISTSLLFSCECPKPARALQQQCRRYREINNQISPGILPSPAAQPVVANFYPSSQRHPSYLVFFFFHSVICLFSEAEITSSYHYFMFQGFASRRLWKGLFGELELTRIAALKPVPTKQILTVPSVDPISRHHPGWGRICASEKSYVQAQEEILDGEPPLPRFLCFPEPKYFPSGEEKQRWLTGWGRVSSAVSLTARWCAGPADVGTSDSWLTAQDWDTEKMKLA